MTAQNRLAQGDGEHFVLGSLPSVFWKQLGYLLQEFNPGIMVLGIHRYLHFSYPIPSKGISQDPASEMSLGCSLGQRDRTNPLWCDISDTATQGGELIISHLFLANRFLSSCHCGGDYSSAAVDYFCRNLVYGFIKEFKAAFNLKLLD